MAKKGRTKKQQESSASVLLPTTYGDNIGTQLSVASTLSRKNKIAVNEIPDRFANIDNAVNPFNSTAYGIDVKDAILLTQKAYWNYAIVRNVIDSMTELTNSPIYLKGGNKASRDFINAWLEKINIWRLKDNFFREYFRSGNIFLYKQSGTISSESVKKMTQTYALTNPEKTIPLKYILLNPAEIRVFANLNFITPQYVKAITGYELEKLKNPKTDEDKAVFDSLTPEEKRMVKSGLSPYVKLDMSKLIAVFKGKQDYEPMAIPMVFPVLDDLNAKAELKKIDLAIARTTDWSLLLVTAGAEPEKGGTSPAVLAALQNLFATDSVKRVIVADYTVKANWVLPDISKILTSEKYTQLDKDIAIGLNSILFNEGEKFSNTSLKVQVFIERLKEARNTFINDFLKPEIKKVCKEFGFKVYPEVYFEEIDLKDELQFARVYTRLMELGILTPEEGLRALESGEMPTPEVSKENQLKFKDQRENGLYAPLVGGSNIQGLSTGRPEGDTGTKKSTNKPRVMAKFSIAKLQDVALKISNLQKNVENNLLKFHKLKSLNEEQSKFINMIAQSIAINESQDKWESKAKEYVKNPLPLNPLAAEEIESIACEHAINTFEATLLYLSKKE